MSSAFDEMMQADMAAILGSGGEFSEAVEYVPRVGSPRSIYGVINRLPPESIGADGMVTRPNAIISVQNNATTGIALSELQSGDKLTYNVRQGVAATAKTVSIRLSNNGPNHDAAVLLIEV